MIPLRVQGTDTFLHLTDKLGNEAVVLLCGDDQRPLDTWALYAF